MTCPDCGNKAIGFGEWCAGTNGFKTTCRSCGVTLKANKATWIGFILTLVVIAVSIPFSLALLEAAGIDPGSRGARFLAIVPIALAGGAAVWFTGGYERA